MFNDLAIDPSILIPELRTISEEIISLFEKHKLSEAEGIIVLSQVMGAIGLRAAMRKAKHEPEIKTGHSDN